MSEQQEQRELTQEEMNIVRFANVLHDVIAPNMPQHVRILQVKVKQHDLFQRFDLKTEKEFDQLFERALAYLLHGGLIKARGNGYYRTESSHETGSAR